MYLHVIRWLSDYVRFRMKKSCGGDASVYGYVDKRILRLFCAVLRANQVITDDIVVYEGAVELI